MSKASSLLIGPAPRTTRLPDDIDDFLRDLDLCLVYQHTELPPVGSELLRELHAKFFSELYVERDEYAQLRSYCDTSGCVIIAGLAGTGKTTLLRKLNDELHRTTVRTERSVGLQPDSPSASLLLYIDLKRMETELARIASSGSQAAVCGLTYQELKARQLHSRDLLERFTAYRIRHDSTGLADLREDILRECDPDDEVSWRAACNRSDTIMRLKQYDKRPDDVHLRSLLDFLRSHMSQLPIVIFDNIDGFKLDIQTEVVRKCVDVLSGSCLPIVAVRSGNLRRIEAEGGRQSQSRRVELRYDAVSRKEHGSAGLPAVIPTATLFTTSLFLRNRIRFLAAFYQHRGRLTQHLQLQLDGLRSTLDELFDVELASTFLAAFDQWNNHSLRHIGEAIARLARTVLARGAAFDSTSAGSLDNRRALRNAAFRQIACNQDDVLYDPKDGAPNIFSNSAYSKGRLPFPMAALLSLLGGSSVGEGREQIDRAATFGVLRRTFAELGLRDEDVAQLVNQAATPPQGGDFGLVAIHNRKARIELPQKPYDTDEKKAAMNALDDKVVELLPRGEFLLRRFSHTCEYLCWMGLDHPAGHRVPYTADNLLSDAFRLFVASNFLRDVVWRLARDYEDKLGRASRDVKVAYRRAFTKGFKRHVLQGAKQLGAFAQGVREELAARADDVASSPNAPGHLLARIEKERDWLRRANEARADVQRQGERWTGFAL